jgi:type IV pilus assembly protein PilE
LLTRDWGFTLTELMIVLVILGIIAAFAYPTYQDQVRKTRRSGATAELTEIAGLQEQFFLDNRTYADNVADLGAAATTEDGAYTLQVKAADAACLIDRCYVLEAVPQGGQTVDDCGTLTLGSNGVKGHAAGATDCW